MVAGSLQSSDAGIIRFSSQADFTASSFILQNENWDSYGPYDQYPDNPFRRSDLTFVAGRQLLPGQFLLSQNFIADSNNYGLSRSLFTDLNSFGMTVNIDTIYRNMFGFNAGNFFNDADVTFTVTTDANTYTFVQTIHSAANQGPLTFVGFQTTDGEYLKSVAWIEPFPPTGQLGTGITDVILAEFNPYSSTVPEPSSLAVFGIGSAGLAGFRSWRRRRSAA